jgi:hypothetical protein
MRPLLITLTAGTTALLLNSCPDMPAGSVPGHSDSHWQAGRAVPAPHESAAHAPNDRPVHHAGVHHSVSEIAWFQGTIDEAFSRRGCPESHPRRTLFRF